MNNAGITVDRFGNHRCAECQRFVSPSEQENGRSIKHSNHCDSKAQPASAYAAPCTTAAQLAQTLRSERAVHAAAKEGAVSAVLSDDEIAKAVHEGRVTVSDAMNRDF